MSTLIAVRVIANCYRVNITGLVTVFVYCC